MSTGKPTLDKLIALRTRRPFGQFGTYAAGSVDGGKLGCTHAVWRFIAFAYTGKWYSYDDITRLSGYPWGGGPEDRGMRVSESLALCAKLRLPYVAKTGTNALTSSELLQASNTGPCMVAIRYGSWPDWYQYKGVNRGAPYARPLGKAGRNQFSGFFGSHAVALMGYQRITTAAGTFLRNDAYAFEPNHDSPARPENVPYDIVTQTDLNRSYQEIVTVLGWSSVVAIVPTKPPTFPGGLG